MDLCTEPPPPIEMVVNASRPDLPKDAIIVNPPSVNPLKYRAVLVAEKLRLSAREVEAVTEKEATKATGADGRR